MRVGKRRIHYISFCELVKFKDKIFIAYIYIHFHLFHWSCENKRLMAVRLVQMGGIEIFSMRSFRHYMILKCLG